MLFTMAMLDGTQPAVFRRLLSGEITIQGDNRDVLTPAEPLARLWSSLKSRDEGTRLALGIAGCLGDADVEITSAAAHFFEMASTAPDGGALGVALGRGPEFLRGVVDAASAGSAVDLRAVLARATATRIEHDAVAREQVRAEALRAGRAAEIVAALYTWDRPWLLSNAAEVVAGTPDALIPLLWNMARSGAHPGPLLRSLRGRVAPDVVEAAIADSYPNPADRSRWSAVFAGASK